MCDRQLRSIHFRFRFSLISTKTFDFGFSLFRSITSSNVLLFEPKWYQPMTALWWWFDHVELRNKPSSMEKRHHRTWALTCTCLDHEKNGKSPRRLLKRVLLIQSWRLILLYLSERRVVVPGPFKIGLLWLGFPGSCTCLTLMIPNRPGWMFLLMKDDFLGHYFQVNPCMNPRVNQQQSTFRRNSRLESSLTWFELPVFTGLSVRLKLNQKHRYYSSVEVQQ